MLILKKLINLIIVICITFSLVFSPIATAGDPMPAGTVLEEDSYVFTIEEAQDLKHELETLENKAEVLEKLNVVLSLQIEEYDGLSDLKDRKVSTALELAEIHKVEVERLERDKKFTSIKVIGGFVLGAVFMGGSIYLGDRIGDSMESSNNWR